MPRPTPLDRAAITITEQETIEDAIGILSETKYKDLTKDFSRVRSRIVTNLRASMKRGSTAWAVDQLAYTPRFEAAFKDTFLPGTREGNIIRRALLSELMNMRKQKKLLPEA